MSASVRHGTIRRVAALLLLTSAAVTAEAQSPARERAEAPRIAVMSAFDTEWQALRSAMEVTGTRVVNGRTWYFGRLAGQEVVLLLSGVSMVNAAMTTQALLDQVPVRALVFSGIAGGVNPSLHVGDVTVPAQWGNYQEMIFARETPAGFAPARVTTAFRNFGMMYTQGTMVPALGASPDSLERRFWFPADTVGLRIARTIASRVTLSKCATPTTCLAHDPTIVVGGNGVSGPTFVDNARFREWAWETFSADALDMETAAVAIVAHVHRVPYIAFRSLSDLAGGNGDGNEMRTFGQLASANSAAFVMAFLSAYPRP